MHIVHGFAIPANIEHLGRGELSAFLVNIIRTSEYGDPDISDVHVIVKTGSSSRTYVYAAEMKGRIATITQTALDQ